MHTLWGNNGKSGEKVHSGLSLGKFSAKSACKAPATIDFTPLVEVLNVFKECNPKDRVVTSKYSMLF